MNKYCQDYEQWVYRHSSESEFWENMFFYLNFVLLEFCYKLNRLF